MKKYILVFTLALLVKVSNAQSTASWNGKVCAVVLTYDDALNIDISNVLPALDSFGLKGTFYISDYFGGLRNQVPTWRKAAANGHELGNHTVFHPCLGNLPGRSFVSADYDLNHYSFRRIKDEINAMNTLLFSIDGRTERTFAYPCGDTKIRDTPYIDPLKPQFIAARGVQSRMQELNNVDLYDIDCFTMNGHSGAEMTELVKKAMQSHTLLVFLFHGVGGEHSLNVSVRAHHDLLAFLKQHQKEIWIAPLIDIARYIKQHQQPPTTKK